MPGGDSAAPMTSIPDTQDWYREYYATNGADRNSLLQNAGVLFQTLAQDAATIRALRSIQINAQSAQVLDVGCGEGATLWLLIRLGFEPSNLFGIDIQDKRILKAKARNPLSTFMSADATSQVFDGQTFDMTMASALFIHLTDERLAKAAASEMIRVTKSNGNLLVSDWRYAKPGNSHYKALSPTRLSELFEVGKRTKIVRKFRGPLVPPLGRMLSSYLAPTYFLVHALLPFLTGHVTTVLRKIE